MFSASAHRRAGAVGWHGYVTPGNNPRQVVIETGKTTTMEWENVKKQARITVKKMNANPALGSYSLQGALFEILNADNVVVDTLTTNAAGEAESKLLPLGNYKVREKTAPYGLLILTPPGNNSVQQVQRNRSQARFCAVFS